MMDWILQIKKQVVQEDLEFFIGSCWSLWSNRNHMVHEGKTYDAQDSVVFIQNYISRYKEAQSKFSSPRPPENK